MTHLPFRTAFQQHMLNHGLITRTSIIDDGKIHRIYLEGDKRGTRNGWYVLYTDRIPAGAFGSWRSGITGTWCARAPETMTAAERVEYRNRLKRIRQQRDAELQQRQQQTAEYAARLWSAAKSADLSHPYLSRKCISVHHLRQSQGLLLVPLIDVHSKLWNLQRIAPDGTKRFLARGRVKGCFTLFGELNTGPLHICEGMATGATIHQQTGMPTACAMNAGNLLAVCSALSQEESQEESQVIVCADNDHRTLGNPGITKGSEAAASIGAGLTWPAHCGPACLCTDFNDITHCGHAQEAAA